MNWNWVRDLVWVIVLVGGLAYVVFDYFQDEEIPVFAGPVTEMLEQFAAVSNRGPAYDWDCIKFGGQPDKMETETLKKLEAMELITEINRYKILVAQDSIFVGYAWKTSEISGTTMFCKFPR